MDYDKYKAEVNADPSASKISGSRTGGLMDRDCHVHQGWKVRLSGEGTDARNE